MNAHDVLIWATREGVHITPDGDQVRMRAPRKPPDELLAAIKQVKPDLLRILTKPTKNNVLTFPAPRRTRAAWTVRAGGKVFSLVLLGGCTASEALAEIRARWPDGELID